MKPGTSLLMTLTVFAGLYQTAAQVTFAPAANYAVGGNPCSVVAVDVNGDGKVDLISANASTRLTVLTNNGSGVFGSNATINVGYNSVSLLAADVNGDGKVDLVGAEMGVNRRLMVFTNNGSGSFVNASNYVVGYNMYGWFMAVDVNGDGRVDLVCPGVGNPLMVLTNAGNGVFAAAAPLPSSPGTSWFCAATDVNGDGKTDLIDVDGVNVFIYMRVLTNDGSGTFTLCSSNTLSTRWPGICTTVDINGDGKAALVVPDYDSGSGNTLTVLTNNGDGVFGSNATYTVGSGPKCVIAADVNGDGKVDLICGKLIGGSTILVLTNNGSGVFGSNSTCNVGINPGSVVAADVNGDGKLDLICANNTSPGTLSVLINTSIFPPPTSTPSPALKRSGNGMLVSWPSASAGWSLWQNRDLTTTNWSPSGYSGYGIADDGTNKSLIITPPAGNLFFRLLHP
jgi:hypothetical protein